jgi:ribosomal RNA-processing protein 17
MAPYRKGKGKQVEQVIFDDEARRRVLFVHCRAAIQRSCREYLTGFRKRNLQKKEAGKKAAIEREKKMRREARQEVYIIHLAISKTDGLDQKRQAMAEQALENARRVEAAYGGVVGNVLLNITSYLSDAFFPEGDEAGNLLAEGTDEENLEFEGEEQLATVTVVEDFDPHDISYPSVPPERSKRFKEPSIAKSHRSKLAKTPSGPDKKKKKKPGFKYETKAARVKERLKQLGSRSKAKPEGSRKR